MGHWKRAIVGVTLEEEHGVCVQGSINRCREDVDKFSAVQRGVCPHWEMKEGRREVRSLDHEISMST